MHKGIGASAGIGIGTVFIVKEPKMQVDATPKYEKEKENRRFKKAKQKFIEVLEELSEKVSETLGENEAKIIKGQMSLVQDPEFDEKIAQAIESNKCAEQAVLETCDRLSGMFLSFEDEIMRQRGADIKDIKRRLLQILLKTEEKTGKNYPKDCILVVKELTPSMAALLDRDDIKGIVTQTGGVTSHCAILARALKIPAVLSVPNITELLKDGQVVAVDGLKGEVIENPTKQEILQYQLIQIHLQKEQTELLCFRQKEAKTKDGVLKKVYANISAPREVELAIEQGAQGIGLFRSEFLFLDRMSPPNEEEQMEVYQSILQQMQGKEVIIRTLDVGGDKKLPYIHIENEENPFLGYRGIRVSLSKPELFCTQLKALYRAGVKGNLKIMFPMITSLSQVRQIKECIAKCQKELEEKKIPYAKDIPIGIMIETPAACLCAEQLAKEVQFFSIGTNDLIQYLLAVDRGNANISELYSVYEPAVLRAIAYVVSSAKKQGIPVGMCGEAASKKELIPYLVSLGLDSFSVIPGEILQTKKTISLSLEQANELKESVLKAETKEEVIELLEHKNK